MISKSVFAALATIATSVYAGIDRAGNVLDDGDSGDQINFGAVALFAMIYWGCYLASKKAMGDWGAANHWVSGVAAMVFLFLIGWLIR